MEQLNRVELIGTVGCVKSNEHFTQMTVATNFAYKSKDGCAVIETTWHNVIVYKSVFDCSEIRRGTCVHIAGRIRNQRYTSASGEDYAATQIIAKDCEIVTDETIMEI